MIGNLNTVLPTAAKKGFAVPAFNCYNLETLQAVIGAAEQKGAPVIVGVSMSAMSYGGPALFAAARSLAESVSVPVVIHLDHFTDLKLMQQGLKWGATSAMFDGSHLPLLQNLVQTKKAVTIAHRWRASLEGELGAIGGNEDGILRAKPQVVDPAEALYFAKQSGVDALALGLGTSHGLPAPHETVDIEVLAQVKAGTNVPLVLHGASNLPLPILRAAIRHGIAKINIDTELRQSFTTAVRDYLKKEPTAINPRDYLGVARSAVEQHAADLFTTFGTVNQAHGLRRRR